MCAIIQDILICLGTGVISGYFVNYRWQKRMDQIEKNRALEQSKIDNRNYFKDDIQKVCHFLDRLQLELDLLDTGEKCNNIRRMIDAIPGTPSFVNHMTKEGENMMQSLHSLYRAIDSDASNHKLDDAKCRKYKSELFIREITLLKNQSTIYKPDEQEK